MFTFLSTRYCSTPWQFRYYPWRIFRGSNGKKSSALLQLFSCPFRRLRSGQLSAAFQVVHLDLDLDFRRGWPWLVLWSPETSHSALLFLSFNISPRLFIPHSFFPRHNEVFDTCLYSHSLPCRFGGFGAWIHY